MANNYGPLQTSGPISHSNVADVFFLFQAYQAGGIVDMSDYYGDKVKWYVPPKPLIPTSGNPLKLSDFYGKRYGLIVDVVVNSTVKNYNLYDYADSVAFNTYGVRLNDPRKVPFLITLTNNSTITSSVHGSPSLIINKGTNGATFNEYTSVAVVNNGTILGAEAPSGARSNQYGSSSSWTIPAGVSSMAVTVVGGGGGGAGGTEKNNGYGGGGGGGGGQSSGTYAVTPGVDVGITVGGGGSCPDHTNDNPKSGTSGGTSSVTYGGRALISAGGGGGGNSTNGGRGGPGGNNGSNGSIGGGDTSWSYGGSGGSSRGSGGSGSTGNGSSGSEGGGGAGGGAQDRSGSWGGAGGKGGAGLVIIDYTINIPGGTAIYVRKPTQIVNNGAILGGISSIGASGTYGHAIDGLTLIVNKPISKGITGTQIN